MSDYNREQLDALGMVRRFVAALAPERRRALQASVAPYLAYRQEVARFCEEHFAAFCDRRCFQTRMSACCSKEGIVTFFADVVINALCSPGPELDRLEAALTAPEQGTRCVYLGPKGCRWRLPPIVCAMFFCDDAKSAVFARDSACASRWQALQKRRKTFTWPDRPVLFDDLERLFIEAGCRSALMYLHNSPGMLRVKQRGSRTAP